MNISLRICLTVGSLAFLPILVAAFFDLDMAVGLTLLVFLTAVTFGAFYEFGVRDKCLYAIAVLALAVHVGMVIVLHVTGLNPFPGGSDYDGYHREAMHLAGRFGQGNFSLAGISLLHYFPVIIGVVYALTTPAMIVGQLFLVWVVVLSLVVLYFLAREIGGTSKGFLATGLAAVAYPSFIYFSSVLLKDSLVILLVLVGLLVSVKMLKRPSWQLFLAFFAATTAVVHFRFYIGFALLFSFVISWFLASRMPLKERMGYGLMIILLLGFSPYLAGLGYYGTKSFHRFLNEDAIVNFREVVYAPQSTQSQPNPELVVKPNQPDTSGTGSSFSVPVKADNKFQFVINNCISFVYALLGPFFWQLRYKKHAMFLLETIPWYVVVVLLVRRAWVLYKNNGRAVLVQVYRFTLPILIFALLALGAMSLFINNFGILARIRMPVFISLLTLLSLSGTIPDLFGIKKFFRT